VRWGWIENRGGVYLSNVQIKYLLSIIIAGIFISSIFGTASAQTPDEGYIISKNSDYSTQDRAFIKSSDTIYMKIWSSYVGDNPKTKKWTITDAMDNKISGGLSPDGLSAGGTKTFVANVVASNFAAGSATLNMNLAFKGRKYSVQETITISSGGNQAPPAPSWISPDSTNDNTPRISWETVTDPNGDPVNYYIKIGTTSGGSDKLSETSTGTDTYYDVTTSLTDDTYYVSVRSSDGTLYSSWYEETIVIDTTPPVITNGPNSYPTTNSVQIDWTTDELSDSVVEYGLTLNYELGSVSDSTSVVDHSVTISSLTTETTYHYRVSSKDPLNNGPTYSSDNTFTTLEGSTSQQIDLKVTSSYVNDVSNSGCYNAISADGGTNFALSKSSHIDAPFQSLNDVVAVNSATLYYDSWGSLTGSWAIYLKDSRDGNTICYLNPAPEDGSETRNSINCNSITPTQLENGLWLYVVNNDNKKPENINLDYFYLDVEYIPVTPITEMWVDDDYTPTSSGGHTWGVDAFNRTQAAIYSAEEIDTTINILSGTYYEKITIDRPVKLIGEIDQGEFKTKINGSKSDNWALILVSANDMGDTDQSPDRDCFPAQGLQAYYTLKSRGYDDDHIIFMLWHDDEKGYTDQNDQVICEDNPNTAQIENDGDDKDEWININYFTTNNWKNEFWGPDGIQGNSDDPVIDVDNKAVTKAALQQQITQLANQVTPDDDVLLYFVNHGRKYGTPEKCQIYFEDSSAGTAGKYLDAATLDSWLDQIISKRMTILIDMCRTQDFIESAPGFTEEPNRLIIGASGDIDNIAHAWYQARYQHPSDGSHFAGSWFFNPFWERITATDTIQQAYQYALKISDQMAEDHPYPYQYPILLDNIRDSNEYSLIPERGDLIKFLTGAGDSTITNLNITGGRTGISIENYNVVTTQALINDASVGYSDVTSNAATDDESYFGFYPTTQAASSDSFMISGSDIFSRIYIKLSPSGAGSGGAFVVECATDRDEWVAAILIDDDNTNSLAQSGDITFIPPLEWAYQAHIHSVSDVKSEYSYWVRLRLTDTYTTIPQGDYIELSYYSEGTKNITGNNITLNNYGIKLKGLSSQTTGKGQISNWIITDNNISSNNYGIYLEFCESFDIYHNNILSNTNQVYDSNPASNNWHSTELLEGNHWSDYNGLDDGSGSGKHAIAADGIGDTAIPHPGTNYDYYPYIRKNGWKS
jgi:parallel beta-helix repeat protein